MSEQTHFKLGLNTLFVFSVFFVFFSGPAFGREPELHVMLAIDTDSEEVGADITDGCKVSEQRIRKILKESFEGKSDRYHFYTLDGSEMGSMTAYIRGTFDDVHSNDTVWFYYCGHGGHDSTEGHYFATSKGHISRSSVLSALNESGARLVVLMSDACSSPGQFSYFPARRSPASWDAFNHLFFQHRGVMDFTAATYPQLGWTNSVKGGFFTQAVSRALCEKTETLDSNEDGFTTWEEAFGWIKEDTEQIFLSARQNALQVDSDAEIGKSDAQTPYAFSFPRDDRAELGPLRQEKNLRITNNTDETLCVWGRCFTSAKSDWFWMPREESSGYTWELAPGESALLQYLDDVDFSGSMFDLWGTAGNLKFSRGRIDLGSYRSQKKGVFNYNFSHDPEITDVKLKTIPNVFRYNKKGILIRFNFIARRLKEQTVQAQATFFKEDGTQLADTNGRYSNSDNFVQARASFVPIHLHTKYWAEEDEPVEIFLPYSELHLPDGERHDLYYKIRFVSGGDVIFRGNAQHGFWYEKD